MPVARRSLLLAVVPLAGVVAGCGGGDAPSADVCAAGSRVVVLAGQERRAPDLSVHAGTAVAAWEAVTGAPVEAAIRRDGRWEQTVAVSERSAARPRVAITAGGGAVVVWDGHDAADRRAARIAVAAPGAARWSAPRDLGSDVGDRSPAPEVTALPAGGAVVTWAGMTGRGPMVADVTARGGITTTDLADARGRVLEVGVGAGRGGVVVMWLEGRGTARVVRATVRDGAGRWSAVRDLSPSDGRANDPRIAVAADGTAVVAWRRDTGPGRQVVEAAVRDAGGRWSTTVVGADAARARGLERPPGPYPLGPRVAAADGGRAVAAWPTRSGGHDRVVVARWVGGRWDAPRRVTASRESGGPDVAFDAAGRPAVVWEDLSGVRLSVRLAAPGGAARVLSSRGQEVAAPRLAADGAGFTVVWNATDRGAIVVTEATPCG